MERQCPYPRRSHGRMAKMYPFDVPWRSKACREKSAEVIVPKTRVSMGKDRIAQCNSKWLLPLRLFCSQMSERSFPTHHDRTESDNRVGVTLVRGMAENNLPHIVRWESAKPPYAEPLVRWCGRSVNVKVGGKCLSMISIYLLPDWTSLGLRFVEPYETLWLKGRNLGPPDYEPQISIFMIFYDM